MEEAEWRQLSSDMVDEAMEVLEEEDEPIADLTEGVGETERLDAAEMQRERPPLLPATEAGGRDESRENDLRICLLLAIIFSVLFVLFVGQGPPLEALSTRKKTTRHKAETKQ